MEKSQRFEVSADLLLHPTRQRMLRELGAEPMTNATLARACGITPAQSHWHLKRLVEAGLVVQRQASNGRHAYVLSVERFSGRRDTSSVELAVSALTEMSDVIAARPPGRLRLEVEATSRLVDRVQLVAVRALVAQLRSLMTAPPAGAPVAHIDVLLVAAVEDADDHKVAREPEPSSPRRPGRRSTTAR